VLAASFGSLAFPRLASRRPRGVLFPVTDDVLEAVTDDMREKGFDQSHPIPIWSKGHVIVDGHTRLKAALQVGLLDVPVVVLDFHSEKEALRYCVHSQLNRRNLTPADILRCVEMLYEKAGHGGDRKSKEFRGENQSSSDHLIGNHAKTREQVAAILGKSTATIQRAQTILAHGDEELKAEVVEGKKSITRAAEEIAAQRKKEKPPTYNISREEHDAQLIAKRKKGRRSPVDTMKRIWRIMTFFEREEFEEWLNDQPLETPPAALQPLR